MTTKPALAACRVGWSSLLLLLIAAGCPTSLATMEVEGGDGSGTTALDNMSGATSSTGDASTGLEVTSSSSGDSTVDPCPPGAGVDWPQRGAFLNFANKRDFSAGPHDLSCSVDRALDAASLEALLPAGTVGALELCCQLSGGERSVVYVAVTFPEAAASLDALVGLQDVSVWFYYGGAARGELDFGVDIGSFFVRDEVGPLLLPQKTALLLI